MENKINTFLIGAQKAGTTSLYDWLGQHSEVEAPEAIKDYHFFTNEEFFQKGIKHLDSFYNKESKIVLHGAVNYMYFHDKACKRIYEYNPNAKIIICLRNPVNRAVSAYNYFKKTLRETNDFNDALKIELEGKLSTFVEKSNNTYIEHGYYSQQIKPFIEEFGAKNCLFVFFEELIDVNKQKKVMLDVCAFLDIDTNFRFNYRHLNASAQPKSKLINFITRKSGLTKLIKLLMPLKTRKKLGKKLEQLNVSNEKINIKIEKDSLDFLKGHYQSEMETLTKLTGLNVSEVWNLNNLK